MASLAQLQQEVGAWLDRGDLSALLPGWIAMAETDIAELLRARCMVVRATQSVDAAFITLPSDFLEMESIRDVDSGELLSLEDHWTGPNAARAGPVTAYRLVGDCIEFLPHPSNTADVFQTVNMAWYQRPPPLLDPQDSNRVLEEHHAVYLWGVLRYGAKFELDPERASQADAEWQLATTAANSWKERAQYSGAPLRAVVRGF